MKDKEIKENVNVLMKFERDMTHAPPTSALWPMRAMTHFPQPRCAAQPDVQIEQCSQVLWSSGLWTTRLLGSRTTRCSDRECTKFERKKLNLKCSTAWRRWPLCPQAWPLWPHFKEDRNKHSHNVTLFIHARQYVWAPCTSTSCGCLCPVEQFHLAGEMPRIQSRECCAPDRTFARCTSFCTWRSPQKTTPAFLRLSFFDTTLFPPSRSPLTDIQHELAERHFSY
jgi:hypothetical protein